MCGKGGAGKRERVSEGKEGRAVRGGRRVYTLERARREGERGSGGMAKIDTNSDGAISKEEFIANGQVLFPDTVRVHAVNNHLASFAAGCAWRTTRCVCGPPIVVSVLYHICQMLTSSWWIVGRTWVKKSWNPWTMTMTATTTATTATIAALCKAAVVGRRMIL